MDRRVTSDVVREDAVTVYVDGAVVTAYRGETAAGVLLASGRCVFRSTPRGHESRGVFCGVGICYDCLVTINGIPFVRACMTPVTDGMQIQTVPR